MSVILPEWQSDYTGGCSSEAALFAYLPKEKLNFKNGHLLFSSRIHCSYSLSVHSQVRTVRVYAVSVSLNLTLGQMFE